MRAPDLALCACVALIGTAAVALAGEDSSGRSEQGKASIYAGSFQGRKMADGHTFSTRGNGAASKTLPLGTTAKVINLDTGKSANVSVQDRGPYVKGRVMDVSPAVAGKLDMKHAGVARVEVKPIAVPQPDGSVKLGTGASGTPTREVNQAVRTTRELAASH